MKGGEIMHFRHFLISGLMVGAALFLPGNAFAEKNEHSGQQNSEKATEQATVPEHAVNGKSQRKTVVVPEPASKNQSGVKQESSKIPPPQAASQKPAAVHQKKLPDQAKNNAPTSLKKTEKVIKAPSSEKDAAAQGKNKWLKPTSKIAIGDSALKSLHNTDTDMKNQAQSERFVNKREHKEGGSNVSVSEKDNSSVTFVREPKKEGKVPAGKEEIPAVNQGTTPTQRTNNSGGSPSDRVSSGLTTIGLMDKWFEWNKYFEIKLVQPYLSRYALMNNQWVNAPPSPPPQKAPLLETVNRS